MTSSSFRSLEEAVTDEHFPEVDLSLRKGRHIGRDDGTAYEYLVDAQTVLEQFYQRFGCELVQRTDGYFYLLPSGERMGRRQLSQGEMLVGQTLALMWLDPTALQHGGIVARELLLQRLAGLVGTEALVRTLNPRKRNYDERVAGEAVRSQVNESLRRLADLGFIDVLDGNRVRLRPALMRFADPVRGLQNGREALENLIARGEVVTDQVQSDDNASEEESEI